MFATRVYQTEADQQQPLVHLVPIDGTPVGDARSAVVSVMGPPNRAPGAGIMGDPDGSGRVDVMGGPDRGLRLDVMGGPDRSPRVDLMGESDLSFVGFVFTG